jgi:GH43 family beta-xylosidase
VPPRIVNRAIAAVILLAVCSQAQRVRRTLTNPLLPVGPDPWVLLHEGNYYYMNTTGMNLTIRVTRDLSALGSAPAKIVWTPPPTGPYSHDIWAPELHFLDHKWYLYFCADSGTNQTHRIWVLENDAADPLRGRWTMKGKVADPSDKWAIDPSVFENKGQLFLIWSGWEGDQNGVQSIYIAQLSNPWTVRGTRVRLSSPQFPWEEIDDSHPNRRDKAHVEVNEGPEVLQHGDKIFLTYSASGCWTDNYALGMLTASASADLLSPASWKKSPSPVLSESPEAHAFGTGHNTFFKSPDGREDWIMYHANSNPHQGCGNARSPRAQPFTWNPDGTPDFGRPVPTGVPITAPSGTN